MDIKDCHEKTDEELVGLILEDQEFFLCLMKRYEGKLKAYINRISNVSREEAEDLLQEVFIKVYKNLNDFDLDLKFSSWIYRIAHNQVISNFRKIKTHPQLIWDNDGVILKNIKDDFDIRGEIDNNFLAENINTILNGVSDKYKEVLILKYLENKDYKEISDILKKPVSTVGTMINRAKKEFKKEAEKKGFKIN